jgi:hypothetical protein
MFRLFDRSGGARAKDAAVGVISRRAQADERITHVVAGAGVFAGAGMASLASKPMAFRAFDELSDFRSDAVIDADSAIADVSHSIADGELGE